MLVSLQNAGGDLAVIGQNRVLYYNPNGRKVREIRHNLYNVDGTCYRSKTLLYDRGGNDLKVYSGEKELFPRTMPSPSTARNSAVPAVWQWQPGRIPILPR